MTVSRLTYGVPWDLVAELASVTPSRSVALGLMMALPDLEGAVWRDEDCTMGYQFTLEDVTSLVRAHRPDVAVTIVSGMLSKEALAHVAASRLPAAVRAAVVENAGTSVQLLVEMSASRSPTVARAARTELSHRVGVSVRDVPRWMALCEELRALPMESLTLRVRELAGSPDVATDRGRRVAEAAVVQAVVSRAPLPESLWWELASLATTPVPDFLVGVLLSVMAQEETCPLDVLEFLALSAYSHRGSQVLAHALVRKGSADALSRFPALERTVESSLSLRYLASAVLTSDRALELFEHGGLAAAVAAASGLLPAASAAAFLEEAGALSVSFAHPAFRFDNRVAEVVRHTPLSDEDFARLTDTAIALAFANPPPLLMWLIQNRHLPVSCQEKVVRALAVAPPSSPAQHLGYLLAHNPSLSEGVALSLVELSSATAASPLRLVQQSLMENREVSSTVRGLLDAEFATAGSAYSVAPALVPYLHDRLGDDPRAWLEFCRLLPEWEGSLDGLVGVLKMV